MFIIYYITVKVNIYGVTVVLQIYYILSDTIEILIDLKKFNWKV